MSRPRKSLVVAALALVAAVLALIHPWAGAGSGTTIQPGQSWDAAYDACSPGDVIQLAAGSYGSQTVTGDKAAPGCTFRPAPGVQVTLADLDLKGSNLVVDGGDTTGVNESDRITVAADANMTMAAGQGNRNVVLEDVHARNSFITANGATYRFGEVGPNDICVTGQPDLFQLWAISSGANPPRNIIIQGNAVHDNNQQNCLNNGDHADALQVYPAGGAASGITIKDNHFWWCGSQCVFLGDGTFPNAVITGNVIEESAGCGNCGAAREVNADLDSTATVRCNTVVGAAYWGSAVVDNTNCGGGTTTTAPATTAATTTAATTTATTAATTTAPPPGCDAACEQAYKDQIASLQADKNAARAWYAAAPGSARRLSWYKQAPAWLK